MFKQLLFFLFFILFIFSALFPFFYFVFHISGERFSLTETNNYTFQIPWFAYSRLHLTLQANDTVKLYVDDDYVCDYSEYDIVIEPSEEALIVLKSSSSVSGMFKDCRKFPSIGKF